MPGLSPDNTRALAAFLALALLACAESEPVQPRTQGISFSYAGALTGTLQSSGTPQLSPTGIPNFTAWAAARPDSIGGLVIAAFQPTGSAMGDLFILQLDSRSPGSFACSSPGPASCHGRLFVDVDTEDLGATGAHYEITSGSVTIADASDTRILGSFSLTLTEVGGSATIVVTDGVIDLPFVNELTLSNGLACLARNLQNGTNDPC